VSDSALAQSDAVCRCREASGRLCDRCLNRRRIRVLEQIARLSGAEPKEAR